MKFLTATGAEALLYIVIVILSLIALYCSIKTSLSHQKSRIFEPLSLISVGFFFLFITSIIQLMSLTYLSSISILLDNFRMVTEIVAFVFFLVGFRDIYIISEFGGEIYV